MTPRIAIPVPHSGDLDYAGRALPQYVEAVRATGGEPVAIALGEVTADVRKQIASCDAVLLPGSKADVDPVKYGAARNPRTADPDQRRDGVDEALLRHAYESRKPLLGICYGLQTLNVHRGGTLVQHIESAVKHDAGRAEPHAHEVEIEPGSLLAEIIGVARPGTVPVNSSHHQSAEIVGRGLRLVARCPDDGVIEAIEGTSADHFVLAVQWHPERSIGQEGLLGESARAIFRAFVEAAGQRSR